MDNVFYIPVLVFIYEQDQFIGYSYNNFINSTYNPLFVDYRVVTSEGITNLGFTTQGMARGFVAIFRCFLGYVIGISLFKVLTTININKLKQILKPLYISPIVLFFLLNDPNYFYLIFFILLIASCYVNNNLYSYINTGAVYKLGIWSYSIYICHRAVMYVMINYFNAENGHITKIAAIILSIIISYFTYTFIEKKYNTLILNKYFKY